MWNHRFWHAGFWPDTFWRQIFQPILRGLHSWSCTNRSRLFQDNVGLEECLYKLIRNEQCIWCGPFEETGTGALISTRGEHCHIGFANYTDGDESGPFVCNHFGPGRIGVLASPGMVIVPRQDPGDVNNPNWDPWQNLDAFYAHQGTQGRTVMTLKELWLRVHKCLQDDGNDNLYCNPNNPNAPQTNWLCNAQFHNFGLVGPIRPWMIECNWMPEVSEGEDIADPTIPIDQQVLPNDNRDWVLIVLRTEKHGHCFGFLNYYCFTQNLECSPNPPDIPPIWQCEHPGTGYGAAELGVLRIAGDPRISQDNRPYPHAYADTQNERVNWWEGQGDCWLKNTILANYIWRILYLYHEKEDMWYDDPDLNLWLRDNWDRTVVAGDTGGAVRYYRGNGAFGDVVPIRAISMRTRTVFPCELAYRFAPHVTTVRMNFQPKPLIVSVSIDDGLRCLAIADIRLAPVVRLLPEAYSVDSPYEFLYRPGGPMPASANNRYLFAFEDPDNPGQATTKEKVFFVGPNDESVPHALIETAADLQSPNHTIVWRGMRGTAPYAQSGGAYTGNASSCSGVHGMLNGGVLIEGEPDRFPWREPGSTSFNYPLYPPRFQGGITVTKL